MGSKGCKYKTTTYGAHGGYETAEVLDVRRIGGERGLRRGPETIRKKSGWGVSWTTSELSASTPTSGRLQLRMRENCEERRNKRGGTCHGEMDRGRESQGWTTACSRMPERDGKDQGEDKPKASGLVLVRLPPGREGKILSDHRQEGNVAVGGIGYLAR